MNLDDIQVGDFALYVLGNGPRVAEVKALMPSRADGWAGPAIGVKPWMTGHRKPQRIGLPCVLFVGTEGAANDAMARYNAHHADQARKVDAARRRAQAATGRADDLMAQVERDARQAAAMSRHSPEARHPRTPQPLTP